MEKSIDKAPLKILLAHLVSNGDLLYTTTIARQIKKDYPNCHLTWAVASTHSSVLNNNPYIDTLWKVEVVNNEYFTTGWDAFEKEAEKRRKEGEFDKVFYTQTFPKNINKLDGSIRSTIFNSYPNKITVPITPVLCLSENEIENVRKFINEHNINGKQIILFECAPKSNQSFINPDFALICAKEIVNKFPNVVIILSSNVPIESGDSRIIDGSRISIRENAELTKYCALLIGCSSGITWISTSDWAKPLPMIQLISGKAFWFASVIYDLSYWGCDTSQIIEMTECTPAHVVECTESLLSKGVTVAKQKYSEKIRPNYLSLKSYLIQFIRERKIAAFFQIIYFHLKRNHYDLKIIYIALVSLLILVKRKA